MLLIRQPWAQQPGSIQPIGGGPLTVGLEALYEFGPWGGRDATGRYDAASSSVLAYTASERGRVWSGARGNKLISSANWPQSGAAPWTVAGWIKPSASDALNDCIFALADPAAGTAAGIAVVANTIAAGDIYLYCNNADRYTAGGVLAAGQWAHVCVTYGGGAVNSSLRLWVNAAQPSLTNDGGSGGSALNVTAGHPIRVAHYSAAGEEFRGGLASMTFWRRELSAAEVALHRDSTWSALADQIIWVPVSAAGGGTTHNSSLTESVSTTDTVSAILTTSTALEETASLADAVIALLSAVADVSETVALADSAISVIGLLADLTESASPTDTLTADLLLSAVVAEAAIVSDSVTALATLDAVLQETLALSEVASCIATAIAELAETAALTDTVSTDPTITADLTETISLADAAVAAAARAAAVSEALSLLDTLTATSARAASLTETLSLIDAVVAVLNGSTTPLERVLLRSHITQAILERSRVSLHLKLRGKLRH